MMKLAKDAFDLGVFVSDIQASLAFYRDTLGLTLEDKNDLPLGTMYRLKCGNSDFKLIDPKKVPPAGASGMPAQLGFRYATFSVTNLSEICQTLKKKGVKFTIEETELRPGVRIAMVKDPDGNTIEFVQRSK